MLLNILLFPIFVYIVSLYGSLFKKIFKIKIEDYLFINLIFGFFFITVLLFLLSFFTNTQSLLIYFVLLILLIISFKYFNKINLLNIKKNIFIILSVSLIPAIMEIGYDSHLYHIPFQTWLQEDKIIIGMANLNLRFGLSSIYSYFSSILWFNDIFFFVSYLTSIFYLVFFLFIYEYLSLSNKKIIYSFVLLLSFPLWSRYAAFAHSLIDVQFGILSIILFTFIIFNYEKWFKINFSNTGDLYLLGILFYLLITLKPSGILFSPLLILLFLFFIIKKKKNLLIFPSLFFSLLFFTWFFRQFIITGCFYYPINFTCLNVEWFNSLNLDYINDAITIYATAPFEALGLKEILVNSLNYFLISAIFFIFLLIIFKKNEIKVFKFLNINKKIFLVILTTIYLLILFLLNELKGLSLILEQNNIKLLQKIFFKEVLFIFLIFFFSYLITLIFFNKVVRLKKSFKLDLNLFSLIFLICLLFIWFFKAPQPRFAYGFISILFPILFINIFQINTKTKYLNLKNKLNFVICFVIIFTVLKNFPKENKIIYNFHLNKKISHMNTNFTFDKRQTFGKKPNFQNLCSSEKNCYLGQDRIIEKLKFNYKKVK
jgi:hypothetical protein